MLAYYAYVFCTSNRHAPGADFQRLPGGPCEGHRWFQSAPKMTHCKAQLSPTGKVMVPWGKHVLERAEHKGE